MKSPVYNLTVANVKLAETANKSPAWTGKVISPSFATAPLYVTAPTMLCSIAYFKLAGVITFVVFSPANASALVANWTLPFTSSVASGISLASTNALIAPIVAKLPSFVVELVSIVVSIAGTNVVQVVPL